MRASIFLAAVLAAPLAAQDIGHPPPDSPEVQAQVRAHLAALAAEVDKDVGELDGTVVANIVIAGDGRLKALDRASAVLSASLGRMLAWARRISKDKPEDPKPFESICQDLSGQPCAGGAGKKEGYLTSLQEDTKKLRDAVRALRAKRKGGVRPAAESCADAVSDDSPARAAAHASTRLALNADSLNTALAPSGSLGSAVTAVAAQGRSKAKSKAQRESARFARRVLAESVRDHRIFMKSLSGKERTTRDDLRRLAAAQQAGKTSSARFLALEKDMKSFSDPFGTSPAWLKISDIMLELDLVSHKAGEVADDIVPMAAAKRTYLLGPPVSGSDHTNGIFTALKNSEEAVRRACGVREGIKGVLASMGASGGALAPEPGR